MRTLLRRRPLIAAAVALAPFAAALWYAAIWVRMSDSLDRADTSAAVTVSVTIVVCAVFSVRRDREKLFLTDVIVKQHVKINRLSALAQTVPMVIPRQLRPVRLPDGERREEYPAHPGGRPASRR